MAAPSTNAGAEEAVIDVFLGYLLAEDAGRTPDAGELLAAMTGIRITHIPYKGTGPAITDLLGGHIAMMFAPIPAAHGNVSA